MIQHLLQGNSHDELVLAAVMLLTKEGYVVDLPGAWESREQFCSRVGISVSTFKRRMRRPRFCPQVDLEKGPKGRLIRLRSNPVFERWICQGSS